MDMPEIAPRETWQTEGREPDLCPEYRESRLGVRFFQHLLPIGAPPRNRWLGERVGRDESKDDIVAINEEIYRTGEWECYCDTRHNVTVVIDESGRERTYAGVWPNEYPDEAHWTGDWTIEWAHPVDQPRSKQIPITREGRCRMLLDQGTRTGCRLLKYRAPIDEEEAWECMYWAIAGGRWGQRGAVYIDNSVYDHEFLSLPDPYDEQRFTVEEDGRRIYTEEGLSSLPSLSTFVVDEQGVGREFWGYWPEEYEGAVDWVSPGRVRWNLKDNLVLPERGPFRRGFEISSNRSPRASVAR